MVLVRQQDSVAGCRSLHSCPSSQTGVAPRQRQDDGAVNDLLYGLADVEKGEHRVQDAENQRAENRACIAAHAAEDRGAADYGRGDGGQEEEAVERVRAVREAVGPALGTAVEVLNEFSDYAAAYKARGSQ